jgi:MscS family membrane protein
MLAIDQILENNILIPLATLLGGSLFLYLFLFYGLRKIFRQFEKDFALVTLNVSSYPILSVFIILCLKSFSFTKNIELLTKVLNTVLIVIVSYWVIGLFTQVIIYYLKEYTKQTEAMWDDVLLPILEAVIPVIIYILSGVFVLKSFGVDLTGIWVALGGATFVIGFALQDILANFFSGIVLLIDTPFRFGDILSLEDGTIGMLKKIGVRFTHLYIFSTHSDIYIPNSVLQGHKITNLSRPTPYYQSSVTLEIPLKYDLKQVKKAMHDIILAHPDTLGYTEEKLELIDQYFQNPILQEQQENGRQRLISEDLVNQKLEEIDQSLEALVATIQFVEKGSLTQDEIENIQLEFQGILELIGLQVNHENRSNFILEEDQIEEALIELVRQWYRSLIRDPNLLDDDSFIISQEWERKINLLKSRMQKLYQKIANPQPDDTRLDDYITETSLWLKEKFKQPRMRWQAPMIQMAAINHEDSIFYVKFVLDFFIDDLKLEDSKRSQRVNSQIYQEIMKYIKSLDYTSEIKQIKDENFIINYDFSTATVSFMGHLDLDDYTEVHNLLHQLSQQFPSSLTLNLQNLTSINSQGVDELASFILSLREQQETQLIVLGSNNIPWQNKSLKNLERLLPSLKLQFQ